MLDVGLRTAFDPHPSSLNHLPPTCANRLYASQPNSARIPFTETPRRMKMHPMKRSFSSAMGNRSDITPKRDVS
jgi:hypothetical protein